MTTAKQGEHSLSFAVRREDAAIIGRISKRAVSMAKELGVRYRALDANMDITACHANGCPLRLGALLQADDFNFAHDVFGIRRHINRTTGQLEDCFFPRFAVPQNVGGGASDCKAGRAHAGTMVR